MFAFAEGRVASDIVRFLIAQCHLVPSSRNPPRAKPTDLEFVGTRVDQLEKQLAQHRSAMRCAVLPGRRSQEHPARA